MKKYFVLAFCLITILNFGQTQKPATTTAAKPQPILTTSQKTSYGLGVLVANNMKAQAGDSLDLETFYKGIKDAYLGKPLQMSMDECSGAVQNHVQQYNTRKAEKLKKVGVTFLEKNKLNADVKTLPSGLQYKVLNTGTGATPTMQDRVTAHYTGKMLDGTIFDSSVQKGQPATFNMNQLIRGWTEALQLMKEGDKWMLFIPQELGYGANGKGQIPPYATLIFEMELIKVN